MGVHVRENEFVLVCVRMCVRESGCVCMRVSMKLLLHACVCVGTCVGICGVFVCMRELMGACIRRGAESQSVRYIFFFVKGCRGSEGCQGAGCQRRDLTPPLAIF